MYLLIVASLVTQWGPSRCGPRGCSPDGSSPSMFQYVQPAVQYVAPVADVPLAEGVVSAVKPEGGVVRVTIDGKEWHVQTTAFNAAMLNASVNISGRFKAKLTSQSIELLPASTGTGAKAAAATPDCNCEDCKCDPCRCGSKNVAAKPEPHSPAIEAIPHNDDPVDGIPNFGVDMAKTRSAAKQYEYSINGRPCTKKQAFESLDGKTADGINDDSKHARLSCIGTDAECKQLESDVAANPAFKGLEFTFQSYRPTDPMIRDVGVAPGHPSVYLQQPDGKVLARWESYAGAEKVAGEIRKRDPNYDPNKDPRPDKPVPTPDPKKPTDPFAGINPIWIIGGLIVLALFKK